MKVLVLGSGGREHALAWRMSQDNSCSHVFVWPGNPGMNSEKVTLVSSTFSRTEFERFVQNEKIDLVLPGSEQFLYDGAGDWCSEMNVPCFGPESKAAELERSKLFSKSLMVAANIPTARFLDLTKAFSNDVNEASLLLKSFPKPVIKISGPSLGKGVFVCETYEEGRDVLHKLKEERLAGMDEGLFVEEAVTGKEVSVFYACNGTDWSYLGSAQDHKRLLDGDKGPNTGGMGSLAPVSWVTPEFLLLVEEKVLRPTLNEMKKRGTPFKGVLFLGLMVNDQEMNLLEYNVRFGDPETQSLMCLVDGDFTRFLFELSSGKKAFIGLKNKCAVHIVKAARGYPGLFGTSVEKGKDIKVGQLPPDTQLFFAGVKEKNNHFITNGGRVLGITALGENLESARLKVYEAMKSATFEGEQFRKDIGGNV